MLYQEAKKAAAVKTDSGNILSEPRLSGEKTH